MKVCPGKHLAILPLFFLFTFSDVAQFDSESYLKTYSALPAKIRVGFIPYKTQVVLGEPLQIMFSVQNLGHTNFEFFYDWNHKGTPGHERLNIIITDSNAKSLPDSYPNISGSWISSSSMLRPGQTFSNVIDLTDYCIMDKPGVYTVNCSFKFGKSWKGPEETNFIAEGNFQLTILERTPERVARVLDELIEKAKVSHGQNLKDTLALAATFGKDDAVPRLVQLARDGPEELRVAAIGALPLVPTETSLNTALATLKDSDPVIRSAAAAALGAMPGPRSAEALLKAFPNENSTAAEAIVLALGATKSGRAFPVITNAFDHGDIAMQHAAIGALVNYGGSNAIVALQEHINTNFLAVRHDIVRALVEELGQPMQPEWLSPELIGRNQDGMWLDSLRLMRLHAGDKAVPALLSYLDYDVVWSGRNWWILNEVQYCQSAPTNINYEYDPNSDGTPEQWTNNFRVLQSLKPLAAQIRIPILPPEPPPVLYLKTDPPINFTPTFIEIENGGVRIESGFLDLKQWRTSAYLPYNVPNYYEPVYRASSRFRALADNRKSHPDLKVSSEQLNQLNDLLRQFAIKLCGRKISDQRIGNFYNLLVLSSDYCPGDDDWTPLLFDYKEAPPGPIQQWAKSDLIDSVQAFSQNYHSGTVEFVEKAKRIFTPAQLKQILD
jgi:hypothetical protein